MVHAKSSGDTYIKFLTTFIIFITLSFSLNAQTFDFESVIGDGTASMTQTVSTVTATVTRSDGGNVSTAVAVSNAVYGGSTLPGGTLIISFNKTINISSFQFVEFSDKNEGVNFVVTPSTGTAYTIADNAAALSDYVETVNPADWIGVTSLVMSYNGSSNWIPGIDEIAFTVNTNPIITTTAYNYGTNTLAVTGENFTSNAGADNDVDVSTLTIKGEGGATYTLSSTADVEITNSTSFSVTLTGADIYNVESLLNKDGLTSSGGTAFNLAAADDWMANVTSGDISDATNQITVSNYANPAIANATYNYSTNTLVVAGTNFVNKSGSTNDVDISLLVFTGEGNRTYQLTSTSDVEITSSTEFSITLSGADVTNVEALLNKDNESSADGTTYNLGAVDNWMAGSPSGNNIADLTGNGITVSNYALPNIASAEYDYSTNVMTVSGTNFVSNSSGADVDVSKFQIDNGHGASTMTVYSTDVEITSDTEFSFTISGDDLPRSEYLMNKDGLKNYDGYDYSFLANDDWMTVVPSTSNISDYPNSLTVSNYAVPVITSVAYNYNTNVLTLTGTDFVSIFNHDPDIDVSLLTIKGEGNATYTLSSSSDVEVVDGSEISIPLSGLDIPNVEALLNKDGETSYTSGTTYNLAAAEDWMLPVPSGNNCADATTGITVSLYAAPNITTCTYNASNGQLVLNGTNFVVSSGANDDIDASLLKIGGAGANEYTLTNTADVDIASATSATLILSSTDRLNINGLLNKNGATAGDLTAYNLAAAEDWMIGSPSGVNVLDGTATIDVNSVSTPTIVSATFNYTTAQFVVTATNLAAKYGTTNDIDVSKITITGEGGSTYTLYSTSDVEATSSTQFSITLSGADIYNVKALLNKNDKKSVDNTTYNFAAAEDWMTAADANATISDVSSNEITVSDFTNPAIASATYDISSGQLVVSGTDFVNKSGANNDIDASLFTITGGPSGATYTLTNTSDVDLTSGTEFTLTLSAVDQLNVNGLLNKNSTVSAEGITYNLAAAEDWMSGSPSGNTIADLTGNQIDVSNVAVPMITSATYNQTTGVFVVTGSNLFKAYGTDNDVDLSKLTITGEGGNYTISNALTDVEVTSTTEFSFTVTGTDKTEVDAKLDQVGQSSSGTTTYNLAAADDWLKAADVSTDISDATGNTIDVFILPTISLATYDASTGVLVVTGANIQANSGGSDIDASKFTVTGEGSETYTLTNTSDVNRNSVTEFTLTLSAADKDKVNQIFNKNGDASSCGSTYNLAAADDWCTNVTTENTEDLIGNGITVNNVSNPTIFGTTYDAGNGVLTVSGFNFVKKAGATNDVDVSLFTLTGEGGTTYCLSDTNDVEITSTRSFSVTLSDSDKVAVNIMLNKAGFSSTSGTTYNLAAAEDWMGGTEASINIADLTNNGIEVSNVTLPAIASASYHWSDGILIVTGTGFKVLTGNDNDIDASKFTFKGEGGGTYTLIGTSDVDINSYTEFKLTLDATDKAAVNILLNKEGNQSEDNTVYNLAAAEDWNTGADATLNIVDATSPITAGNFNTPPTGDNESVNVVEDSLYTFTVEDFTFNDVDNDNFDGIKIISVETHGDLDYNGSDVTADLECPDVTLLQFVPGFEESGSPYAVFEFKVKDDRGGFSDSTYTMTINVGPVNDLPEITSSMGFSVDEGGTYVLTNDNIKATDTEDDDYTLSISITQQPQHGMIVTEGTFTQNDVANGKVYYQHDGSDEGTDTLKLIVIDSGLGKSPEVTLAITVNNINDAPVVSAINAITMHEDESYNLDISSWYGNIDDPDNPDSCLTISVTTGAGLSMNKTGDNIYIVTPETNFSGTTKLFLTVSDSIETVSTEVQVNVIAVNDLPVLDGLPGSISLEYAGSTSFIVSYSDVETPDSLLSLSGTSTDDGINISFSGAGNVTVTALDGFSGMATVTITLTDEDGGTASGSIEVTVAADPTGLERLDGIPDDYSLNQNYPNPFNPSTTIRFGLPEQSDISLQVYDILGREIKLLVEATKSAGYYEYSWNADNYSSGIYFYVLTASSDNNQFRQIKKMLLVK